jgi:hypothetical protein
MIGLNGGLIGKKNTYRNNSSSPGIWTPNETSLFLRGSPWTPADITTAIWLDAAEASTITLNSGAVETWNDKSGNIRHFSQSTAASRPTVVSASQNGLNTLSFDGSNDHLNGPTSPEPHLIATVAKTSTASTFKTIYGALSSSSGSEDAIYFQAGNPARTATFSRTTLAADFTATAGVMTSGSFFIMVGYHSNTSIVCRLNGTPGSTDTTASALKNLSTSIVGAGYFNDAKADYWPGEIGEVIIVSNLGVGLSEAQQVEGYLAHKWGLTAGLPADHPYKTVAPTSQG